MKKNKNTKLAIKALQEVINRLEGEHSGLPQCCIEVFVSGRTSHEFRETLSEKNQKKYNAWGYVPCDKCFKNNKKVKIKMNGTSHRGEILYAVLKTLWEDVRSKN